MAGKHRRTRGSEESKQPKPCKWCKGAGGFHSGGVHVVCGRCMGRRTR
ncbi:hypothetical protein AB0K05_13010 [Nonomuraea sp. NPDC049486]